VLQSREGAIDWTAANKHCDSIDKNLAERMRAVSFHATFAGL